MHWFMIRKDTDIYRHHNLCFPCFCPVRGAHFVSATLHANETARSSRTLMEDCSPRNNTVGTSFAITAPEQCRRYYLSICIDARNNKSA